MEEKDYILMTHEELEKRRSSIMKKLKQLKGIRWTMEVIAAQTRLTPASISRYIWGQRNMSLDTIIKLDKALGLNPVINKLW